MSKTAWPGSRERATVRAPRVLLIEDDPALALMLTWELEERGVSLILARNCAQARALSRGMAFHLALVDADLPDGDGVVLAEGLAQAHPHATIAVHSGRRCEEIPCRRGMVKHFLSKPVPLDRLLRLLQAATAAAAR